MRAGGSANVVEAWSWLSVIGEAAAVSAVMLGLFKMRHRWGWAPMFSVLGALQLLPLVASTPLLTVAGHGAVDRGWLVVTGALALMFLVVHLRVGAHRARQLLLSLIVALAVAAILAAAWSLQQPAEQSTRTLAGVQMGLLRAGLLFIDCVAVITTWEVLGRLVRPASIRLLGALSLTLAFDALCVAGAQQAYLADWSGTVLAALFAALLGALAHGAVGYAYLRTAEDTRWLRPERDRALLDVLAVMMGTRRYTPLRPEHIRDEESGLYDALFFRDNLQSEVTRAETYARALSLVVLEVSDAPDAPDAPVLGRALMAALRMTDIPCRTGARRYVALMPGADRRASAASMARLLEGLGPHKPLVSIGIAVFPHAGATGDALLAAAEQDRASRATRVRPDAR